MLVNYLKSVDDVFYGLDRDDLAHLAYEFAAKNKILNPFKNRKAGEQWLQNFMRRNPSVVLRKPEATSLARAHGFNKPQVELFFQNLGAEMDKNKFPKSMIWNVDETGECYLIHFCAIYLFVLLSFHQTCRNSNIVHKTCKNFQRER